ncbi:MAG: hypothetical protein ACM3N4_07085 [Nitrososphaerota archaeon]
MAHQYLNDGEEKEVRSQPTDDSERNDVPHEDSAAEAGSNRAEESSSTHAAASRPRRNKSEDTTEPHESHESNADGEQENAVVASEKDDIQTLEALGFTRDEATRLIDVSVRINGATLKRLQFTKWLVDQGLLDEFSVRD